MATENKIVWLNLTFFGRVKEILILTEIYCVSDILCNGTITKTFNARKAKNTQICSLLLSESQFQLYNLAKCLPSMYKAPSLVPSTSKNKNNPHFPDPVGLPSHCGAVIRMSGCMGCRQGCQLGNVQAWNQFPFRSHRFRSQHRHTYRFKNVYLYEQYLVLDLA